MEILLTAHRRGFYGSEDRRGLCAVRYRVTNRGGSAELAINRLPDLGVTLATATHAVL